MLLINQIGLNWINSRGVVPVTFLEQLLSMDIIRAKYIKAQKKGAKREVIVCFLII